MIQPVNKNLLIEPLKSDSFLAKQDEKFEQIGEILSVSKDLKHLYNKIGYRVYFDSWLAGKYINPDGEEGDFYWLVNWEDIKAIEKVEKNN